MGVMDVEVVSAVVVAARERAAREVRRSWGEYLAGTRGVEGQNYVLAEAREWARLRGQLVEVRRVLARVDFVEARRVVDERPLLKVGRAAVRDAR